MRKALQERIPKELRDRAAAEQKESALTCQHCGKTILPSIFWKYPLSGGDVPEDYTLYSKGYDRTWCSLVCARAFANAAHRAGYRIKGLKA